MPNKPIDVSMAKSLLRASEVRLDRSELESNRWPGPANMLRLANAVHEKLSVVVFSHGKSFKITYNDDNVKLKPSTGGFVPMGFFSYKQLSEVRAANQIGAV